MDYKKHVKVLQKERVAWHGMDLWVPGEAPPLK